MVGEVRDFLLTGDLGPTLFRHGWGQMWTRGTWLGFFFFKFWVWEISRKFSREPLKNRAIPKKKLKLSNHQFFRGEHMLRFSGVDILFGFIGGLWKSKWKGTKEHHWPSKHVLHEIIAIQVWWKESCPQAHERMDFLEAKQHLKTTLAVFYQPLSRTTTTTTTTTSSSSSTTTTTNTDWSF